MCSDLLGENTSRAAVLNTDIQISSDYSCVCAMTFKCRLNHVHYSTRHTDLQACLACYQLPIPYHVVGIMCKPTACPVP